jgi:hypothetical protein
VSEQAIEALTADRDALLEICNGLNEADFDKESGCPGWSVKDVVSHMGALYWMVVDPSALPELAGLGAEKAADLCVEERRSWDTKRVVGDYQSVSTEALGRLSSLIGQDFELDLGDLGKYPAHLVINAYVFDHYTHIREDLFGRGPLQGSPPESDELRLIPTLAWPAASIEQLNPDLVGSLQGSVEFVLEGLGARTIKVGLGERSARVECGTKEFIPLITHRASWEASGAKVSGDDKQIAIARELRVY